MGKTKGRLTLPSESNFLEQTKELLDRWGADAIRDSDGTKLDEATNIFLDHVHSLVALGLRSSLP